MTKERKATFVIPEAIKALAERLTAHRLAEKKQTKKEARAHKKAEEELKNERLKKGLVYATKIMVWAQDFRSSTEGRRLMHISHMPTTYKGVYFFDGEIQGLPKIRLGISSKGLFIDRGGRFSSQRNPVVCKSVCDLAQAVETIVLEVACDWIESGAVWVCIERGFQYFDRKPKRGE